MMTTIYDYKREIIARLVGRIKGQGLRVFLAERKTHGFFTDADGSKVVSFQCDYFTPVFSGNYITNKPGQTGTGWRITEEKDPQPTDFKKLLETHPPQWALRGASWRFVTLADHLNRYQASSKYAEVL